MFAYNKQTHLNACILDVEVTGNPTDVCREEALGLSVGYEPDHLCLVQLNRR